jgi:hypothetical protein
MEIIRLTRSWEKTWKSISYREPSPSTSRGLMPGEQTPVSSVLVEQSTAFELPDWQVLVLFKPARLMPMGEYQGDFGPSEELEQAGFCIQMASGSKKCLDKDLQSVGQIFGCHQNAAVSYAWECKRDWDKKAALVEELEEKAAVLEKDIWVMLKERIVMKEAHQEMQQQLAKVWDDHLKL